MDKFILDALAETQWHYIRKEFDTHPLEDCRNMLRRKYNIHLERDQAYVLYNLCDRFSSYTINAFVEQLKNNWDLFTMADNKIRNEEGRKAAKYFLKHYRGSDKS